MYIVYVVKDIYSEDIIYIGSGKSGRERHANSGSSHIIEFNVEVLSGKRFDVEIVHNCTSKEEIIQYETELILKHLPIYNTKELNRKLADKELKKKIKSIFGKDTGLDNLSISTILRCKETDVNILEKIDKLLGTVFIIRNKRIKLAKSFDTLYRKYLLQGKQKSMDQKVTPLVVDKEVVIEHINSILDCVNGHKDIDDVDFCNIESILDVQLTSILPENFNNKLFTSVEIENRQQYIDLIRFFSNSKTIREFKIRAKILMKYHRTIQSKSKIISDLNNKILTLEEDLASLRCLCENYENKLRLVLGNFKEEVSGRELLNSITAYKEKHEVSDEFASRVFGISRSKLNSLRKEYEGKRRSLTFSTDEEEAINSFEVSLLTSDNS